MTYRPEFAFWSDADDITEHVVAFEFDHGVNILNTKTEPDRAETGGSMLLENFDGYWTVARLDALGVIEKRWKTEVLARATVFEHEFDKNNGLVRVDLQSAGAAALANEVSIAASAELTPAEVITASGVAITPESAFAPSVKMDQGGSFMGTAEEFADAMAIFTDGFVYENHLGELRLLEKDDSRGANLHINVANFDMEEESAVSYLRRRWRRDAQNILTLGITLERVEFDRDVGTTVGSLTGFTWNYLGHNQFRVFFSPYLGLTEEEQMRFRFYEEGFSGLTLRKQGASSDTNHAVFVNAQNPIYLYFNISGDAGTTQAEQRAWLRAAVIKRNFEVFSLLLPTVFDEHPQRLMAGATVEHGLAPDMPWAISEDSVEVVQSRLEDLAENVPRVTKIVFPMVQETEARFRQLVEHRIGSISDMFITEDDLSIHGIMANLFIRWRWEVGRYNSVEMHFLQLRSPATEYRLVRLSEDNPIFRTDADNPLYRGIA